MASFFDEAYRGVPPWDIGRPQPAILELAETGQIQGRVLDVGCGTGDNALYLSGRGHEVTGIDGAPRAIEKAKQKARQRGLSATFLVADALDLAQLGRTFDTAIDSGLFHVFSDPDRLRFAESLASIVRPDGRYFLMCFSEHQPGVWGPRRVTQAEIRETFRRGWRVDSIQAAHFDINQGTASAWLATITRLEIGLAAHT